MNAYELADELLRDNTQLTVKAAYMLRQQADRIAELENQSQPVAWMEYIQDEEWEVWYTEPTDLPEGHSYKPLYLAPQTKPLSDDEILNLYKETGADNGGIREFVRAIEERHGIK